MPIIGMPMPMLVLLLMVLLLMLLPLVIMIVHHRPGVVIMMIIGDDHDIAAMTAMIFPCLKKTGALAPDASRRGRG